MDASSYAEQKSWIVFYRMDDSTLVAEEILRLKVSHISRIERLDD